MIKQKIIEFLNSNNYDVRISKNGRWIDQKCTPDVVSIIADCILEYTNYNTEIEFSIKDIWYSIYAKENVIAIFSKPEINSTNAKHEYDKFFSQPIKLLAYSNILNETKKGNKNVYKINNLELLEYIMQRDTNSLIFLIAYIKKVLKDSGIYDIFQEFLTIQTKEKFKLLKDKFIHFTINNTSINEKIECGRIFTKVLNPLAYELHKRGTERGNLSKNIITIDELRYNRTNWRDELSNKDKTITRKEHYQINIDKQPLINYNIEKAKKIVRKYNETYNSNNSEVKQRNENVQATQIHHIFPVSDFPTICDYIENLISLTPNQHFTMAHPNNNTAYIDKDFQYICILAKTTTILEDYNRCNGNVYCFDRYKTVLNIGLKTSDFDDVKYLDFDHLLVKIDYFYSDFNTQNYQLIAENNRPKV